MEFKLVSKFKPAGDQPKAIKEIIESLKNENRYQTLQGVTGSGKTFIMASVIEKIGKPTLVIAPNKTLAAQLYSEYKNFFPKNKVCYFVSYYDYYQPEAYIPVTDTYIDKEAMINEEIDRLRHYATSALLTRKDVVIVASVSCIYNLGVPETYFGATLNLHIDKPITRGDLIRQLVKIHFERTPSSLKRGYFRVRGDVFEIMPASEKIVYRVELKDQRVSDLALVEQLSKTGKKFVSQKGLIIFPPKHFISTEPEREHAIKDIKKELKERLAHLTKNNLFLEVERLERRTKYDLEMRNSKKIIEAIIRPTGLVDPEVEIRPVYDRNKKLSQINDVIREVEKRTIIKERVLVLTLTKKMAEELSEFLSSGGIKAKYLHSDIKTMERVEILTAFRKGDFDVLVGINLLREGLDLPEVSLVAILDADKEGFLRSDISLIQTM